MKKVLVICLAALLAASMVYAGGSKEGAKKGKLSIGMTVNDLSNQIWSASCQRLETLVKADGGSFTYIECKSNPNTQIKQVEDFITKGVDAIIIQVAEPNALENVLGQARKVGIKVFCWDNDIQNSDVNWLISNYDLGRKIGEQAAKWINEKFGGSAEFAVLNYDSEQILLERGNGIRDAIAELAPQAKKVGDQPAINPLQGQTVTESLLQANPNLKVIACIGGGGAVGANNAVKAAGRLSPEFGIFAADATPEEIVAMENNEAVRMSVLITGNPTVIGDTIYDLVKKLIAGQSVDRKVMRTLTPITVSNINLAK